MGHPSFFVAGSGKLVLQQLLEEQRQLAGNAHKAEIRWMNAIYRTFKAGIIGAKQPTAVVKM
ncbi:hypothetical protein [Paenibacillus thiaminolyticus]|uniref:hypothetical protein n=1 Tax=Paenibacillus thiaminolyticus TaxID=49283 RepID=UPI0037C9D77F